MSEKIAFIGIGNMGLPMAKNLMNAGKKVKVFDVSKKMLDKAKNENLEVAENIDSLIDQEISFVITMLPEGKNSEDVYLFLALCQIRIFTGSLMRLQNMQHTGLFQNLKFQDQ